MRAALATLVLCTSVLAATLITGCKDDNPVTVEPPVVAADALPDFSLPDVNSTSPTMGQEVSPRDHLGHLSAWYFGHST